MSFELPCKLTGLMKWCFSHLAADRLVSQLGDNGPTADEARCSSALVGASRSRRGLCQMFPGSGSAATAPL